MDSGVSTVRARTKIACEECRRNKRKCDGQRPTCLLCEKSGRVCTYISDAPRKRKYVDEDLITHLQHQISGLESQLRKYRESHALRHGTLEAGFQTGPAPQDGLEGVGNNQYIPPYEGVEVGHSQDPLSAHPPNDHSTDARSHEAMEELASLMLTMDLEGQGEPSFTLPPGNSQVALKRELPSNLEPSKQVQGVHEAFTLTLETRRHLVGCFMQKFNIFHEFLDERDAKFIIQQQLSDDQLDSQFRNYALFAVGAHLSDDPDIFPLSSEFAGSAERMVLESIRQHSSDLIAQGLVLLAWRELVLGNNSMAYNYIAMATGVILHLGLHVSAFSQLASNDTKQNMFKRRVRSFWAYFSVDRLLTCGIGMNCTMHWQRVRAPPYLKILDGTSSIDDMAHDRFCQLWHLWDSCMDQVHAFGWVTLSPEERNDLVTSSHKALEDFYYSVDPRLQIRKDHMPESAVWFQMAYHAAILLIHRPFLNEPSGSSTLEFALRSATSAAASICRIVRACRKHGGFAKVAPQIIDYILSAAVIHLLNATSGHTTLGRQSAHGIRSCVEALLDMQPKWNIRVQRSLRRIQELAHRWKAVWALPICLSQPLSLENQNSRPQDTSRSAVESSSGDEGRNLNYPPTVEMSDTQIDAGLWNPDQYVGALDQIHGSWGMLESWDLDMLFQPEDPELGIYSSEPR